MKEMREEMRSYSNNITTPISLATPRDNKPVVEGMKMIETKLSKFSGKQLGQVSSFGISGLAALSSHLVHHPLYTLKSHMMMHGAKFQFRIFAENTLRSPLRFLYRGLVSRCMGIMPEKALKMQAWSMVGRRLEHHNIDPFPKYIIAGSAAGAATTVLGCPSERIMVLAHIRKKGVIHVAKTIGMKGMYQGWRVTLYRDVMFNCFFFTTRDMLVDFQTRLTGHKCSGFERFAAGLPAGILAASVSCPLDVAKTKVQGAKLRSKEAEQSTLTILRDIVKQQGPRYLFKGLLPRIYVVPSMMSLFYVFDEMFKQFAVDNYC